MSIDCLYPARCWARIAFRSMSKPYTFSGGRSSALTKRHKVPHGSPPPPPEIFHDDVLTITSVVWKEFLDKGGINDLINRKMSNKSIYEELDQFLTAAQWERVSGGDERFTLTMESSATIKGLPDASFVGQQETYPNVMGYNNFMEKLHLLFASQFSDREMCYRRDRNVGHDQVALVCSSS
ncbi:ppsA [Symbiodinium natans]|uniref:pyruvate, water dikinase n=1 Tax=Symbiodinium natans TaxID=878477 RepID=A0A812IBS5_9DINO|nr:ppsA [Symbiodinium natans]